jgi:predicted  nucleic acid-binding Zn-ribbon protein
MKTRLEKAEKQAAEAEQRLEEIAGLMEVHATDYQTLSDLNSEQEMLEENLLALYEEIEELSKKLLQ